jgi:hypothetical protein
MCWANGMIGTTILTGFHCSRKQITIFVMAKELAARCFATKPKRTTIFQTFDNIFGTCWHDHELCEGGKVKLVYEMDKIF